MIEHIPRLFADLPPGQAVTFSDINNLGYVMLDFIYGTAVTVAIIAIIWSGVRMMTAGADGGAFKKAGTSLRYAVIGLLVIFGTGVIISTVASIVDRSFFCPAMIPVVNICIY